MGKLKAKVQSNKIDGKSNANQGCSSDQHPWFSLRYMTTNKNHSLAFLGNGSDRETTLSCLFSRLEELSGKSWLYWTQQPKQTGLETIHYDQLNFSSSEDANLTKDTTIYVFRFDTYQGNGKGRIIGFKSAPCSVFHIIGYDFDFSAYKH